MNQELNLTINGHAQKVIVKTKQTLLEVLREQFNLFSVREGCGVGMCGSCTVLVDDQPMCACLLLPAQVAGKSLTTVEGLSQNGELHFVQKAFLEATGYQCSFCTPGFILSTISLLREKPDADDEQIREYLSGNLCRCGSYNKIMDAVLLSQQFITREDRAE